MSQITILAPAFNEEAVITAFVTRVLAETTPDTRLLVVDDGSSDATPRLLAELAGRHPRLKVVTHADNRGLGAALVTGFRAAETPVVVTMDADLSHPLELVPRLAAGCDSADAVFASRFVPGGGMTGVPLFRRVISRVGNGVMRRLLRVRVRDMTTGFRAYRTTALRDLELTGTRFETQLEITVRLVHRGARIDEIPLVLTTRAAGESKMRYLPLLPRYGRMFLTLLALRWLHRGS